MSIPICFLQPDGKLVPASFEADSLDQVGSLEPDGIYTIARTFDTDQAVMLDAHMDRLEQSARLEDIALDLDRPGLRSGLRRLLEQTGYEQARFRITIPRNHPETPLLAVEPLQVISENLRSRGVSAATICIDRPNPQAKSNRWIQLRDEARKKLPDWAYEGLVCTDEGQILEGFSSNFYAVHDGELHTARDIILSGIARQILLIVADGIIGVSYDPVRRQQVPLFDEALLTSSSRGVVPIVRIDEFIVGEGVPGPVTQALWRRYQRWVGDHLEKI